MIEKKLEHIQRFQTACQRAVEKLHNDVQQELSEPYYQNLQKALHLTQVAQKDLFEEYRRFFEHVSEILALEEKDQTSALLTLHFPPSQKK